MSIEVRRNVLGGIGAVLAPSLALFTARMVYEQTLLPWRYGASRFGFSVLHSYVDAAGALILLVSLAWALGLLLRRALERSGFRKGEWFLAVVIFACCGAWLMPGEQWMVLTARAHDGRNAPNSWILSASATGQLRLLNFLPLSGVDIDTRGQYGESPLGAAAAAGQLQAAQLLLVRGARLENRTGTSRETALIEAAATNHTEVAQLLLAHGADARAKDAMDRTALDWARYYHNVEMADALRMRAE